MSPEWLRLDLAVVKQVGAEAALTLALIEYRSGQDGWAATRETIAADVHLSEYRTKKALADLHGAALLTSGRADRFNPLKTWRSTRNPVPAEKSDIAVTCGRISPDPDRSDIAVSSYEEEEEVLIGLVPEPQVAKKSSRRRPKRLIPDDYKPLPRHWEKARATGVDLAVEGPLFVAHHTSKGNVMADWHAALDTWLGNAAKWAAERQAQDNVTPIRPVNPFLNNTYDPATEAALPPPPKQDIYG